MASRKKNSDPGLEVFGQPKVGPPANVPAERFVLGGILRDNSLLQELNFLSPDDFYQPAHRLLFGAARDLETAGLPVDLVSLVEKLGHKGVEAIGGAETITDLFEDVPAPVNVPYYARIISRNAQLRHMVIMCRKAAESAYDEDVDPADVRSKLEKKLYDMGSQGRGDSLGPISDRLQDVMAEIAERRDNKSPVTGISTGYPDLDRKINGLRPSDLIIVAGRPGMGKTSLVMNIAENITLREDADPVLLFSLEMSGEQLLYRLIASRAQVDSNALQRGLFSQSQWKDITDVASQLNEAPLYIDDDPLITVDKMLSKSRYLMNGLRREAEEKNKKFRVGAVIVDYLQLMVGRHADSREREIGEISRGLKILAKELNVPVIALSQLNRSVESRDDKRPKLNDLRESGAIEQDADLILFIYRDALYQKRKSGADQDNGEIEAPVNNTAEIIVGKNRHGSTGTIELTFDGRYTRFYGKANEEDYLPDADPEF